MELARGVEAELIVEGRNAEHLAGGQPQVLANSDDRILGYVPLRVLDFLQDRDQGVAASIRVFLKDGLNVLCDCCHLTRSFLLLFSRCEIFHGDGIIPYRHSSSEVFVDPHTNLCSATTSAPGANLSPRHHGSDRNH